MTEADWLAWDGPQRMLAFVRSRISDRKLRLYFCAGCRFVWHLLVVSQSREAVEVAERFADGAAAIEDLGSANYWAELDCLPVLPDEHHAAAAGLAEYAACGSLLRVDPECGKPFGFARHCTIQFERMRTLPWPGGWLIREVVGNPFHPVSFDPAWRTANVVALAQAIYEERELPSGRLDRTRLAILADALLDAGCESDDILAHCRSEGPHVRGCWVIDLIMGKE